MAKTKAVPAAVPYTGVRDRVARDRKFRRAILGEVLDAFIEGEINVARSLLRDYINGAIGFEALARATGIPSKSLMRMFGPNGNPQADNLFNVLQTLQRHEGVHIVADVRPGRGVQRTRKAS